MSANWKFRTALAGVLFAMAVLPYLPALQNDFLPSWDDGVYVLQNYRIHHLHWENVVDLFRLHPQRGQMPNGQYTPLVELSYMLEHHFFGLAPGVFHLTNVWLHGLNTLLVFFFVRRLTGSPGWAWWTAAFFAVHPLHVESVAWVAERKDMLSALFYLGALIFYLRHRSSGSRCAYGFALLMGIGAFLSKPLAVTLPAVLMLCDFFKQGAWSRKSLVDVLPFFALSIAGIFITFYTHVTTNVARSAEVWAVGGNLLIAARGVALYVEKFIWPFGLSAFYPAPAPGQPFAWSYYLALAALVWLTGWIVWQGVKGRHRVLVFSVLFFLVALSPSSRIIPVGLRFLAADRFFYLPGIGLFVLLAHGVHRLLQTRTAARHGAAALAAGLLLLWSWGTWERSQVWRDDVTLWRDALAKYPDSAVNLGNIAHALAAQDLEAAGRFADQALALSPNDSQALLIKVYQNQRAGDYDASLGWLDRVKQLNVVNPTALAIMEGWIYCLMGDHEKAIAAYDRGLAFEPLGSDFLGWMAVSWLALGDESAALDSLGKMNELNPSLDRQARLLAENSPRYSVLSPVQQAVCLSPDLMRYQYELAQNSQFISKDQPRALREYRLLLDYYPAVVDVWQEVAANVPRHRWPPQVYDIRDNHVRKLAVAFYNQACLLAKGGSVDEAVAALRSAVDYDNTLIDNALNDSDLAVLRAIPEFIAVTSPPGTR